MPCIRHSQNSVLSIKLPCVWTASSLYLFVCVVLLLQPSGSSGAVQLGGERIGGVGGTVALSSAAEDEQGVRRDDVVAPCQLSEGGDDNSLQTSTDDKNREKHKDGSESEGGKDACFSKHTLFSRRFL